MDDDMIVCDPEICNGKPVVKGTRVPVQFIVEMLKAGHKPEDIHKEYPSVPMEVIMYIKRCISGGDPPKAKIKI